MKRIAMALMGLAACGQVLAVGDDLKPGDRLKDSVLVGKGGIERSIPLPAGDWEVLRADYKAKGIRVNQASQSAAPYFTDLVLAQRDGPDLVMLMHIRALREDTQVLKWVDEPCRNAQTLYRNVYDSGVWDTKCMIVNHIPGFISRAGPAFADIREWTVKGGVRYPSTALSSTLTKFATNEYARVTFWVNPALRKLDATEDWKTSPFHRDRIAGDPERKKYVDEFVAWSESYMERLTAKKASSSGEIPGFR